MGKIARSYSIKIVACMALAVQPAWAQGFSIPIPIPSFGGGRRQIPPYYQYCMDAEKLAKNGDKEGAIAKYQQAIQLEPNKAGPRINLGRILDDLGRSNEAIQQLETALAIDPADPIAYVNLIAAYVSASRLADAIAVGQAFHTRFPGHKLGATIDAETKSAKEELDRRQKSNRSYGFANGTMSYPQASNYFALTTDEGLLRWSFSRMPIKVFVPTGKQGKYVRAEYAQVLTDAFKEWQTATQGNISFVFIDDPTAADITVEWNDDYKKAGDALELGEARFDRVSPNREIDHITISMLTHNPAVGTTLDPQQVQAVGLHEIGHALGLHGHSDNPNDIMYFAKHGNAAHVSPRDVNTLKMIYIAQIAPSGPAPVAVASTFSADQSMGTPAVQTNAYMPPQQQNNSYAPPQSNSYAQPRPNNSFQPACAPAPPPQAYAPMPQQQQGYPPPQQSPYAPMAPPTQLANNPGTQMPNNLPPNGAFPPSQHQPALNDGFTQPTPVMAKTSGMEPFIDTRLNGASPSDALRFMESQAMSRPNDPYLMIDLSVAYNNRANEILNTTADVAESERLFRQALNLQGGDRNRQMQTVQNLCRLLELTDRMGESNQLKATYGSHW